jgi:hypothetical protein
VPAAIALIGKAAERRLVDAVAASLAADAGRASACADQA